MTLHWQLLRWAGWSITAAWIAWALVWTIAAVRTKPQLRSESFVSRMRHMPLLFASMLLLLLAKRTHPGAALVAVGPPVSWLFDRFIAFYPGVVWIGAPLMLAGTAFAFWARFQLGGNWSSTVALKQQHELITTGPYRIVRHPIYAGALLAVAGTACAIGQWRGLLALALTFCSFWLKSRMEERLMLATFGDSYRRYQSAVKGMIPFVL